jgi:hypothetical protein
MFWSITGPTHPNIDVLGSLMIGRWAGALPFLTLLTIKENFINRSSYIAFGWYWPLTQFLVKM